MKNKNKCTSHHRQLLSNVKSSIGCDLNKYVVHENMVGGSSMIGFPLLIAVSERGPLGLESHKVSETSLRNLLFSTTETGLRSLFLLLPRLVSETFFLLLLRLVSEFCFLLF